VAGKYRQAIREGRLALVSACAPEASFHIGNAMARNKLLYALADWSLVVCAETDKGGTWSGAQENLQKGWTPLLVRTGAEVPEGNTRLLEEGGLSLDEAEVRQDTGGLRELLEQAVRRRERLAATAKEVAEAAATADPAGAFWEHQVWPTIAGICRARGSLNEQDLVGALGIEKAQGKAWLKRAVEERKLRKLGRPVRYRLAERSLFEEG
jgi:predicted Rossmann fold nucleotide-binding protein DprA/Smf involved in DNA uptake